MSLYGALAENTRRNERVERGIGASFSSGSQVITVPGPMRQVTWATAQLTGTAAPGLGTSVLTVGNIGSGGSNAANQFTIFAWMPTSVSNPTLIASTAATIAEWQAWGNLSGGTGF